MRMGSEAGVGGPHLHAQQARARSMRMHSSMWRASSTGCGVGSATCEAGARQAWTSDVRGASHTLILWHVPTQSVGKKSRGDGGLILGSVDGEGVG
jgi:hypothetical protein